MTGHVASIHIYPIKGIKGIELQKVAIKPRGPAHDRRWMLVDEQGRFLSQRQVPEMGKIRASVTHKGLRVHMRGAGEIAIGVPAADASRLKVAIWRDDVEAVHASARADRWFSAVMGRPCRLVYMDRLAIRAADPGQATVSFADGYPLLLTSVQSLNDLNARMTTPLSMKRFRPNIVIDGFSAFAEDQWHEIQVGAVRFRVVKSCARCVVTTIDPETSKAGREPLRTLSTFRKRGSAVYFGENLVPAEEGILSVGDAVSVVSLRSPAQRLF